MSQQIQLSDGSLWVVRVASSLDDLRQERAGIRRNLLMALGFIGALSTAGAGLLTATVLRPLSRLREEVSHRWEAGEALNPRAYPDEVAGLVSDINELLLRNRDIVDRARRQAADMAHALKTPSAALRNELESRGLTNAIDALDRIDAHITRSLARVRAENGAQALSIQTDLVNSIKRIARLLLSMPISEGKVLDVDLEEGVFVVVDRQDIEELMGNLLENAFKWCDARVAVTANADGRSAVIQIADDGPGIPETQRKQALDAGARLDTSVSGTGLGLAIACDLVHAYGGTLELGDSPDLGGLLITITVPRVAVRETRNAPALEKAGAP